MRILMSGIICSLLMASSLSFAQEKTVVTAPTGKKVVAVVGDCTTSYERDTNGNLLPRVDLTITYCKEFVTYEAIVSGKFWNQDVKKIDGTEKYSDKLDNDISSFSLPVGTSVDPDKINLVEMQLRAQCRESQKNLQSLIAPNNCTK